MFYLYFDLSYGCSCSLISPEEEDPEYLCDVHFVRGFLSVHVSIVQGFRGEQDRRSALFYDMWLCL